MDFKLEWVKGVGSLRVTSITNMVPHPDDDKIFSVDMELTVLETQTSVYYKLWQDPLPAIKGNDVISANNIPGKATGTLVKVCGEGYFLTIDTLLIQVPQNVVDTSGVIALAESIGLTVSAVTNGIVDLNELLFGYVNTFLSSEIRSVLNDILATTKIMDADC